ncbi:MAG: hypothetical protein EXR44_01430 [Dehalococcoidia bacterium]|nr:hypothetical protein [Dehalococcoidia bacterium]
MAEKREELLAHYQQMRSELLSAIDGLSDRQMTETSIDGWSVTDHLAHIAFWDDLRAGEVVRISAGHESALRMTGGQDTAYNTLAYEFRRGMKPGQVRWELETSRRRLLDAISLSTERGMDASLYGEAGLRTRHEAEHAGWIKRWRNEKGI